MNSWLLSALIVLGGAFASFLVWAALEVMKRVTFQALDEADAEIAAERDEDPLHR